MTKNMKTTLASIFLFGSLSMGASFASMTTMNGKAAVLSDYIGKGEWTIVEAWHSKCHICMKAMPDMVKASGILPNAGLVGVSLDGNLAKARQVVKRFDINFPTLSTGVTEFADYLKKISGKELVGVPTYLVFSPDGTLRAMQEGNVSSAELQQYLRNWEQENVPTLKQTLAEQIIANQAEVELVPKSQ